MQPVDAAKKLAARRRSPHTEAHWVPRSDEHAVEPGFGPNTPDAMRSGVDGLAFFTSAIASLAAAAA